MDTYQRLARAETAEWLGRVLLGAPAALHRETYTTAALSRRGLVRSCDEMAAEATVVLVAVAVVAAVAAVAVAVTVADMVVACGGCCRRRTRRAFSTVLVIAEPGERARS